jgi:DNA-damage-inducible protein D
LKKRTLVNKMVNKENALVVFQGMDIRREWYKDEWYFSIVDIVAVLTDSTDPKQYIKKIRQRDPELNTKWGIICTPVEMLAPDGKIRTTNSANTESLLRLIQSIPSKKVEPFKVWLAKVGYERIQEIENPELAQNRAREYYKLKGYPLDWVEKRMRSIGEELNKEWGQIAYLASMGTSGGIDG